MIEIHTFKPEVDAHQDNLHIGCRNVGAGARRVLQARRAAGRRIVNVAGGGGIMTTRKHAILGMSDKGGFYVHHHHDHPLS